MLSARRRILVALLLGAAATLGGGAALVLPGTQAATLRVNKVKTAAAAATVAVPAFRFQAYENFNGKLHLNWKPLRPAG